MSYIIGNKCVSVCDTTCVKVCPVNCIHGQLILRVGGKEVDDMSPEELKGKQLYINPEECILCGVYWPECPPDALFFMMKMKQLTKVTMNQ